MAVSVAIPSSLKGISRSGSKSGRRRGSRMMLVLLLGMVVGTVFVCGLYVGSSFMKEHNSLDFKPTFQILSEGRDALLRGADQRPRGAFNPMNPVKVLEDKLDSWLHRHTPEPVGHPDLGGREAQEGMEAANHGHEVAPSDPRPAAPHPNLRSPGSAGTRGKAVKAPQVEQEADKGGRREEGGGREWSLPSEEGGDLPALSVGRDRYAKLSSAMDELSVTVSAWIFLDSKQASTTMNTILANKASGCETTPDRMGYALYVNTWETTDRQLILEWGNDHSGCAKLGSGQSGTLIEYDTWTHVGAVLGTDHAAIYVNGKQVAMTRPMERKVQQDADMVVGRHTDDQYPFFGRVSSLAFFRCGFTAEEVVRLVTSPLGDGLFQGPDVMAALPLADAPPASHSKRKPKDQQLQLRDTGGQVRGRYVADGGAGLEALEGLEQGIPEEARSEVTDEMRARSDDKGRQRRGEVREAMRRVWSAYRKHAWGHDELKPISLAGQDNWGGIGCTLVDSLDTLWLMGLRDEFWEARDWVRDHLTFAHTGTVSVFETTIRDLGGLLSAYDLSGDEVFLSKAKDLGERLLGAFDTPSGVPMGQTNLQTKHSSNAGWTGGASILAELGTLQVEFRYLSAKTGDARFAQKVNRVFDLMASKHPQNGLYPIYVGTANGDFANSQITFGALGDSFYEYMIKVWLQGGRQEAEYRRMFDEAMDGMMKVLLKRSKPSGLLYVSDLEGGHNVHKMDHLVCFLPAVLALGAVTLPEEDSERAERYMTVAKGLTHTCYQMYHRYPTHLAPEFVRFVPGQDMVPGANFYILRPETAEALFYMHEITGHPIYREWAWEIFQGIERHCRTNEAYGAHPDVTNTNRQPDDRMESFFLAETLKYLYLIQDPDHPIDLQKQVFNTEAHPLRVFDAPPGRTVIQDPAEASEATE